jgi:hypothetical protein
MPPADYAEMVRFFDEPYDFPAEWAEVKLYTPEFQAAIRLFQEEAAKIGGGLAGAVPSRTSDQRPYQEDYQAILQRGAELTPAEWAAAELNIRETTGYLTAWSTLSQHHDYEMEAIPIQAPSPTPWPDYLNFLELQRTTRFLCLRSHLLARNAAWAEAFSSALSPLRIVQRHPASILSAHLVGIACERIADRSIARLAIQCPERASIEEALHEMNRLDSRLHRDNLEEAWKTDVIGSLRVYKRRDNVEFDLNPGRAGIYYFRKSLEVYKRHVGLPQPLGIVVPTTFWARFMGAEEWAYYTLSHSNPMEPQFRFKVTKTEFDLARLLLANRLRELDGEAKTSELTDLIPKWLPSSPNDPFADKPYLWDAAHGTFYGIGPDQRDDGNSIRYDPTNGTKTTGDIALP